MSLLTDFLEANNLTALTPLIGILPIIAVLWVLKSKSRAAKRAAFADEKGSRPGIDDPKALADAEKWASTFDLRQDLADKGFVIVEEFDSLHGFSPNYMEDLINDLTARGLETHYQTLQPTPAGVATINQSHLVYLLYCHQDDADKVKDYIKRRIKS